MLITGAGVTVLFVVWERVSAVLRSHLMALTDPVSPFDTCLLISIFHPVAMGIAK
jgi:hypothetical protein